MTKDHIDFQNDNVLPPAFLKMSKASLVANGPSDEHLENDQEIQIWSLAAPSANNLTNGMACIKLFGVKPEELIPIELLWLEY